MSNSFLGLHVGLSGIRANQAGLTVTANNLANAGTEGYARKQIKLQPSFDVAVPNFSGKDPFITQGTGVEVGAIVSIRDLFLNGRIRDLETELNKNSKEADYLEQIELLFANDEVNTGTLLNEFFASLQDLANNPESITSRQVVIEKAVSLTENVRSTVNNLFRIQQRADEEIEADVKKINEISAELALINHKIADLSGYGLEPGEMEDRRQVLLEDLSRLVNIQTVPSVNNMVNVLAGGQTIVGGTRSFNLVAKQDASNYGYVTVRHEGGAELFIQGGEIAALTKIRDDVIEGLLADMDTLVVNLTDRINSTHRAGFGLNGKTNLDFFTPLTQQTNPLGIFRVEGAPSGYTARPDLPLDGDAGTTTPENFESNPIGRGSFVINGTAVSYNGAVDSLNDIVERINAAVTTAHAYVSETNHLVLAGNANNGFTITGISDSGVLMERLGILKAGEVYPSGTQGSGTASLAGSFQLPPAERSAHRFSVSNKIIDSPESIAAAGGIDATVPPDGIGDVSAGPGDNKNALALAGLKFAMTMSGGSATYNDYYNSIVGEVGVITSKAKSNVLALGIQEQNLLNQREQVQGVSIDEELVNMIKFQKGYQAAARIISAIDESLKVLMGLGA